MHSLFISGKIDERTSKFSGHAEIVCRGISDFGIVEDFVCLDNILQKTTFVRFVP